MDNSDNEDEENAGQKTEEVTAATSEDIETPKEKIENREEVTISEAATTFETATSEETMTSEEEKTETPEEAEVMKTDASTESSTMKYWNCSVCSAVVCRSHCLFIFPGIIR